MLEGRVVPATITVTSLGDSGAGTLRAAIEQANLDTAPDTITFDPTVVGTITLLSALPDLSHSLVIDGPGALVLTVARSGAAGTPDFRIFTVPNGADDTIAGLTLARGFADEGGGIFNAGTLAVIGSTIRANGAYTGGGVCNEGTLALRGSIVSGNSGHIEGGGGILNRGTLTVTSSTIDANDSAGPMLATKGGGILNRGTLTLINSTISENLVIGYGGGISNSGTLTVLNSTLSGNTAYDYHDYGGVGGGIDSTGKLTVIDSTFSGNRAQLDGGGVVSRNGNLTVIDSILSGNLSRIYLGSPVTSNLISSGKFLSGGHNLFSDSPNVSLDSTDLINTNPLLGPLADNGGPTKTMALLPGSPAIDAGASVAGVATDQREVARPQGSAPDIGAFESRGYQLVVTGGDGQTAQAGARFSTPLGVAVNSPFGEPVAGGRVVLKTPTTGPSAILGSYLVSLDANGRGSVTATANELAGSYRVTASAKGAGGVAWSLTNEKGIPPVVLTVRRSGVHWQPTRLVLAFSQPLDPASASNLRNYALVRSGPNGRPSLHARPIPIKSAVYDLASRTVTITPSQRLGLHDDYWLIVRGKGAGAVASAAGTALDGTGSGQPGSNFVVLVHGFAPYTKAPAQALPAWPPASA